MTVDNMNHKHRHTIEWVVILAVSNIISKRKIIFDGWFLSQYNLSLELREHFLISYFYLIIFIQNCRNDLVNLNK